MSCWDKQELENMLEDVVNELNLSEVMIEKHGPLGMAPAELVRLVLEQKDLIIDALKHGFHLISKPSDTETKEESTVRIPKFWKEKDREAIRAFLPTAKHICKCPHNPGSSYTDCICADCGGVLNREPKSDAGSVGEQVKQLFIKGGTDYEKFIGKEGGKG